MKQKISEDSRVQDLHQQGGEVGEFDSEEARLEDDLIDMACDPTTALLILRVIGTSDIMRSRFQNVVAAAQLTLAGTDHDDPAPPATI